MKPITAFLSYVKTPKTILKSIRSTTTKPKELPKAEPDVLQINNTEKTLNSTKSITEISPAAIQQTTKRVRGINFNLLDKNKTYIGLQYSNQHKIAKQIVRFTKKYCTKSDVPAHVFALSHQNGEWWVYESHIMTNEQIGLKQGSHKLKAKDWYNLGKNRLAETDIYEANLDTNLLDKNAGQPYSFGDAFKHALMSVLNKNGKQDNCEGLLCSEYVAMGMKDICKFYNLKPWCVTPAHFKDYMVKHSIKQVNKA